MCQPTHIHSLHATEVIHTLNLHELLLLLHELLPRLHLLLLKLMRHLVVDEFVMMLRAASGRRCCWDSVLVVVDVGPVGLVAEVVTML